MLGVVGPLRPGCHPVRESKKINEVEGLWEVPAKKVIPL
jgi:hypothetical protein